MNSVFRHSGRSHLTLLLMHSSKSVASVCYLAFPFASACEFCFHISSITSPCTANKSIQYYRNYPMAASPPMSPILCNYCLPVHVSISKQIQMVLSLDNGLLPNLGKASHLCFLPLVEHTTVGLLNPSRKLLQGVLSVLQPDWEFTLFTTHVLRIVTLSICIIIVVPNLW